MKKFIWSPPSSGPLIYYYPQIKIDSFKKCQNDNFSLNREKVYVIPYTVEIHGVDYKNYIGRVSKTLKYLIIRF